MNNNQFYEIQYAVNQAFPYDTAIAAHVMQVFSREKLFTFETILEEDQRDPKFFEQSCQLVRGDVNALRKALVEHAKRHGSTTGLPAIEQMTLKQLLQETFVDSSPRRDQLVDHLRTKISVVLVAEEKLALDATVDLYEQKRPLPRVGEQYGPQKYRVVELLTFYGKRLEIAPFPYEATAPEQLVEGFDNKSKAQWGHIPADVRCFVLWMVWTHKASLLRQDPRRIAKSFSHKTLANVAEFNDKEFEFEYDDYVQALKDDKNLHDRLMATLYPIAGDAPAPKAPLATNAFIPTAIRLQLWMTNPEAMKDLRKVLTFLYSEQGSIQIIAKDSDINVHSIDWAGSAEQKWQSVLKEASKQPHLLENIVRSVLQDYRTNFQLNKWMTTYGVVL